MALATGQTVRDYGRLDDSATDELLVPHINAARRELKSWIGPSKYAEAEAAAAGTEIHDDLVEAEAYLAYFYAVEFLGLKHTPQGFATQGQIGDGQFNYLGPERLKEMKTFAWNRAREAAKPYLASSVKFHLGSSPAADEN